VHCSPRRSLPTPASLSLLARGVTLPSSLCLAGARTASAIIRSRPAQLYFAVAALLAGCGDQLVGARDAAPDAPDAGPDATGVPDLTLHGDRARSDLAIGSRDFAADACELDPDEDCIGGPGLRQLLYFSVETPNIGTGDMILGQPSAENPDFAFSECHDHFHFEGYASYELVDPAGDTIAVGRKQAFCLVDSDRFVDDPSVGEDKRYSCLFQGIQRGWSDVYGSDLPCQFLDITGVPPGAYTLRVEINRERGLEELDYTNNLIELPVDLSDADLATPTESCATDLDPRASRTLNRECGWESSETFACTPGNPVRVGCNQSCGSFSLGSCSGDPMMRVCDADGGNCSYPAAIGASDNACQSSCPIANDILCPASGMVEVFVAPKTPGDPVDCTPALVDG
jgi:hypothetical protein